MNNQLNFPQFTKRTCINDFFFATELRCETMAQMCGNGGTCQEEGDLAFCTCEPEYTGNTCQTGKIYLILKVEAH